MFKLWSITKFVLGVIMIMIAWVFFIGVYANQSGSFFNKGHNAVWLGHKWVGEEMSRKDIQSLVKTLKENQIDTVFVHSGPFEDDGTVDPNTYKYAMYFLETARKFNKDIKYQAWLGQKRIKVDLNDTSVRKNIAKQCVIFSKMVDFDGIHFDIEPVHDGDKAFIQTLSECKNVLSDDKNLSVSLAEFIPNSLIWFLKNIHSFSNYNTEVNYKNVAKYADQVVVMTYDTGFKTPFAYKWLLSEEVIRLTSLLKDTEVFIGIPAYEEGEDGAFNPDVENIETGVKGVLWGLNNIRSNEKNFAGISIYPYWEISDEEFDSFQNLWLK